MAALVAHTLFFEATGACILPLRAHGGRARDHTMPLKTKTARRSAPLVELIKLFLLLQNNLVTFETCITKPYGWVGAGLIPVNPAPYKLGIPMKARI
jgi:hypothetical protein